MCDLVHVFSFVEILFFVGSGDESQFDEACRHRCFAQHEEHVLLHPLVLPCGSGTYTTLHQFGQFHALRHVPVVQKFKHDGAFGRVGVIALIAFLVVFLYHDDRVLAHGGTQFFVRAPHTHGIGFQSSRHMSGRQGVGVYGDKHVGLVLVGYLRPSVQWHKHVCLACIDHPHVRAVVFHKTTKCKGNVQVDVLFVRKSTFCPGIMPAVPSIHHQCEAVSVGKGGCCCGHPRQQDEYRLSSHVVSMLLQR